MPRFKTPEQRTKHRDPASFSIGLSRKGGDSIYCKALNLSIAGMLLDYDGTQLAIGSQIDIFACISEWKLEIPATVIHSNSNCTGIMFREPQPDLYRAVAGSIPHACLPINSRAPLSIRTGAR